MIYQHGYCDECGGSDCEDPFCELSRRWDSSLQNEDCDEDILFQCGASWYFYDAWGKKHGPFTSEVEATVGANKWLQFSEE